MIEYIVIAVACAILGWVIQHINRSGFFSKIEPVVTEKPSYLSNSIVVYYKYCIGAYSGVVGNIKEAKSLLPTGSTTFGIFYDNPDTTPAHLLQSAIGVVFSGSNESYDETHSQRLLDAGFEKMVLPAVSRAVQAVQPSTDGVLSFLALVNRTYGIIRSFISDNRLETKYAVEFYAPNEITVVFPLEKQDEFVVPDYLPTEKLEAKLARKKFDSDEEDSESEPDGEEVIDSDEVEKEMVN